MNRPRSARSIPATCVILNSGKEQTPGMKTATALDSNQEQAMDNGQAREVLHL